MRRAGRSWTGEQRMASTSVSDALGTLLSWHLQRGSPQPCPATAAAAGASSKTYRKRTLVMRQYADLQQSSQPLKLQLRSAECLNLHLSELSRVGWRSSCSGCFGRGGERWCRDPDGVDSISKQPQLITAAAHAQILSVRRVRWPPNLPFGRLC